MSVRWKPCDRCWQFDGLLTVPSFVAVVLSCSEGWSAEFANEQSFKQRGGNQGVVKECKGEENTVRRAGDAY